MRVASLTTTSSLSLPASSYIYEIVPVNGKLAAISSDDTLRLIDLKTLREIAGGVLNNVHDGVTCLRAVDRDPDTLLTAGRDGVVQGYDLRMGQKTVQLKAGDSKAPFLSLASHGANVAAGTELSHSQAAVLLWSHTPSQTQQRKTKIIMLITVIYRDTRSPSEPLQSYTESHNDDVTTVQFHPTLPPCLLSGSTDGLVNIFDVSISDEDDALVQVQNHGSSINRAGFLSDSDFFALSHDETFSIYHLNGQGDSIDEPAPTICGDLRPKLDCEYVVDVIPSRGSSGVEAVVAAGSHSKRHLDLISLRLSNGWSFDPDQTIRLSGAHGEEIVRSIHVDNENGAIFTAGEDGLVKAWRTSTGKEGAEQGQAEAERPRKKKRKSMIDGGNESGRFKPY